MVLTTSSNQTWRYKVCHAFECINASDVLVVHKLWSCMHMRFKLDIIIDFLLESTVLQIQAFFVVAISA